MRGYANLPVEVPDSLLATHIAIAWRTLVADTGYQDAPSDQSLEWAEAQTVGALASAIPWLNTFALSGAAKIGRLEGAVEYRFLDPEDVAARVASLLGRYRDLVAILGKRDDADAAQGTAVTGDLFLISI